VEASTSSHAHIRRARSKDHIYALFILERSKSSLMKVKRGHFTLFKLYNL